MVYFIVGLGNPRANGLGRRANPIPIASTCSCGNQPDRRSSDCPIPAAPGLPRTLIHAYRSGSVSLGSVNE